MSKLLHGRAAIYGIDGTIAYTGVASTEAEIQGMNLTDDFDSTDLMNRDAEVIGTASRNPRQSITVDVVIVQAPGGGQSIATAKGNFALPAQMAIVALADFGITALNGDWNYAGGGTAAFTTDGYMRLSLPLRRNAGAALVAVGA